MELIIEGIRQNVLFGSYDFVNSVKKGVIGYSGLSSSRQARLDVKFVSAQTTSSSEVPAAGLPPANHHPGHSASTLESDISALVRVNTFTTTH